MTFPITIDDIKTSDGQPLTIYNGLLTLLGANGTGKTQLLRSIEKSLSFYPIRSNKVVKFFSAGRMAPLEQYRSNFRRASSNSYINEAEYDKLAFGYKPTEQALFKDESLLSIYHNLVNRPDIFIKIQEKLAKLLKKDLSLEWNSGNLQIKFSGIDSPQKTYSAGREASGLLHLIGLLIALYDEKIGLLLIDEPEVSLHPQLQAFLLKEIKSFTGLPEENNSKKIIIIATHSTDMLSIIKPTDICNLAFCNSYEQPPIQLKQEQEELKGKEIQKAILEIGQRYKQVFFCKKPLLVEGRSDQIICEAIADKSTFSLEATGVQILPVEGIGNILPLYTFLKLLNKAPIILVDADMIADNNSLIHKVLDQNTRVVEEIDQQGKEPLRDRVQKITNDFSKLINENIENIKEKSKSYLYFDYYNQATQKDKKSLDTSKNNTELINKRLAFCLLFNSEKLDTCFVSIKKRFEELLNDLEKLGLFVLRKGTIECYYQQTLIDLTKSKIDGAMDEALYIIEEIDRTSLENSYSDILRCIQYSSNTFPISEARLLQTLLRKFVYELHKIFQDDKSTDLQAKSNLLIKEDSKIFSISQNSNSFIIDLKTTILDVAGFPITISKDDDANTIEKKIEQITHN